LVYQYSGYFSQWGLTIVCFVLFVEKNGVKFSSFIFVVTIFTPEMLIIAVIATHVLLYVDDCVFVANLLP
jgi:hypothetical protein